MDSKSYLWTAGIAVALALLFCATANFIVDPYRLFWSIEIHGFNQAKPRAAQRSGLAKTYGLAHVRPRGLILGNSRAEVGLDPNSPSWPVDSKPVYNAAVPGTSIQSARGHLQHALAVGDVRTVVVGLEFLDFPVDSSSLLEASVATVRADDPLTIARRARDALTTLLSLDALFDSMLTVLTQRNPYAANPTESGFNPMNEYTLLASQEGYGALFTQRDQENARRYIRTQRVLFLANSETSNEWRALEDVLRLCREHQVQLHLAIYPYHAHTLELFRLTGLWPMFESWKLHLMRILQRELDMGSRVVLWDFSGYHQYAREAVPAIGDKSSSVMWYWEAGHFKKELGEKMLAKMFGHTQEKFGVRLTMSNVQHQLTELGEQQAAYEKEAAEEVASLRALVESSMGASR